MSSGKEVIYIDIEDDITAIIGKVKSSSKKIVALVPPKRASVFTSFVNLKLLKKAAKDTNKRLVIVTADDSLTTLAGGLGLYVAKNLQTPPAIPEVNSRPSVPSAVIQAGGVAAPVVDDAAESPVPVAESKKSKNLKPLDSGKKLPDFNRFRKWLLIGGAALVALVLLWWWAFLIAPSAEVVVSADQTRIRTEFDLDVVLDGDAENSDDAPQISGQRQSIKLEQTAQAKATGKKNKGKKASGELTITNCGSQNYSVSKGDGFSADGLTFISAESTTVPQSGYSFEPGGFTCDEDGQATVGIVATQPGGDYNLSAQSYQISGSPDNVQADGSAMSGGTDDIVTVLTKDDVERALAGLSEDNTTRSEILEQLTSEFSGGVYLFDDTLVDKTNDPKATPGVGSETDAAEVVATQTYSIVGVSRSELETIITKQFESELKQQQAVTNTGIDDMVPTINEENGKQITFTIISNGLAGPDLDIARLKDELTGRRYSEALSYVEKLPSVNDAEISLSPIWVGKMPRSASKITVTIESPGLTDKPQSTTDN